MSDIVKDVLDMTFKEFVDEAKKQGTLEVALINEMLGRMRKEGFTDDETYNMPMSKLWKVFSEVVIDFMTDDSLNDNKAIELNLDLLNNLTVKKTLESLKKLIKNIED